MKENLWLKLASVALALALWFFVVSKGKSEIRFEAPVVYENVPAGLVVLEDSTWSVEVAVSGHERFIRALSPGDVKARVDLRGTEAGMRRMALRVGNVSLPPSLEAVEITPGHVEVHIDRTEQKALPVQPHVTGRPAAGFMVAEVEARPAAVNVEGPQTELKRLEFLSTEPLDISGAKKTVMAKRALLQPGRKVTVEDREVEVKVVIRRQGE